jgi:hypothetical protein
MKEKKSFWLWLLQNLLSLPKKIRDFPAFQVIICVSLGLFTFGVGSAIYGLFHWYWGLVAIWIFLAIHGIYRLEVMQD